MPSQGPLIAGTGVDDAGIGATAWANPSNVTADDGTNATATIAGTTHYLKATNFGFSIPAGATIDGIVVEWDRGSGSGNPTDAASRIVKGGTIGSTDKSSATPWPTTVALESYGGAADLWGESWAVADINDSTFGAAIAAQEGGFTEVRLDYVRITVYYTEAGGASVGRMAGYML